MLQDKMSRIQKLLVQNEQDMLFVGNFGHHINDDILYWLLLEQLEYGFIIIPSQEKPTLYVTSFEVEQLKHKRSEHLNILPAGKPVREILLEVCQGKQRKLAIRPQALPVSVYQQLTDISSLKLHEQFGDEQLTMIKLPKEIERMKQAASLTDTIFQSLLDHWSEFYTEADAANFILRFMAERGVEPSFPPIVASGKNAANPHHRPTYKQLQPGFCVIDFGLRFKGYCSDMTRTIFIGRPTVAEKNTYQKLLSAQVHAIEAIRPGVSVQSLDELCRQELGEELSTYFIHSLGHGLGSQVHEFPSVSKKNATTLEPNMVITIEPGVYLPGQYGIRIEDEILVTEHGCEILTQSSKTLHTR